MAESSLYAGERDGARVFQVGRIGFDTGTADLGLNIYTGTFRSERVAPAGVGSLINFRRVAIHLYTSGTYTFTVRVWVEDTRTVDGTTTEQVVTITGGGSTLQEITEEIKIEANGSHIQVEITIDSDNTTGIFLVEKILARGRIVRRSSGRTGEAF